MDFSQLKSFYYIATLGNFNNAAEAVHRTTSAVSYQIKALEESLGCTLFERLPKQGAVLTPAGERLLRFAEDMFQRQSHLLKELDDIRQNRSGHVRIALPPTLLHAFFPEIIARFQAGYPNIGVQVLERLPAEAMTMLHKGGVDFCVATEGAFPAHVAAYRWKPSRSYLVVKAGHPLLDGPQPPPPRSMAAFPLIVPVAHNRYSARRRLERIFENENLSANIVLESNNVLASLEYVRRGLGICFMSIPDGFPYIYPESLRYLDMEPLFPAETLCVCARAGVDLPPPARAFLETVLGCAAAERLLPRGAPSDEAGVIGTE